MAVRTVLMSLMWVLSLGVSSSEAHFLWVRFDAAPKDVRGRVCFGETARADKAEYLAKLPDLKLWSRSGDRYEPVESTLETDGEKGTLVVSAPQAAAIEAYCLYGVFAPGSRAMLLHYYAKAARGHESANLPRSTKLAFDVVTSVDKNALRATVLWNGEPVTAGEVIVRLPDGSELKEITDATGSVTIRNAKTGLYEIWAKRTESSAGEHMGQAYDEVRHYCTLTFDLPALPLQVLPESSTP